ncbi:Alpha-mannosidase [Fimbriimonas ginsengisoli Gsoil 348]|uniref:Alpha-mannosidase n=2 Tax=Fimbriimonas ginsengisoli TaxID=1005039 RepID=A0A068NU87_FIMGI|nr:Alpha-mannosidase [Fimbriimonas ginsengisoli Gsoil 348]
MHWVDMEWLWGYHVLPGSIHDMLRFCHETGAKGNVNFDGVGYEKLASEYPEALSELRKAVQAGTVEVVGASYGQPYGALHGGESNIRQRIYGVRSAMRLLGIRPRTFWEEEFDFFPQLPQILSGVGFDGASLFFQWTWHTPEIPFEEAPVVLWTGHDGTTLRAATRNRLNLHQWPEDVDVLLSQLHDQSKDEKPPLILQWLELMPSPDWMCRSQVLLPKTKELLSDPRFEFRFSTLGEYLRTWPVADLQPRRYKPHEVFHGMSLGKNGDLFRRLSRKAEQSVLDAETLAAVAGLFGRPYAQWDVYPTWELEEAWRELLQAQHHDNDECEGLCGHIGRFSYERSLSLSGHVLNRTCDLLSRRIDAAEGDLVVFNALGWPVSDTFFHPVTGEPVVARDVPALGWRSFSPEQLEAKGPAWELKDGGAIGRRGEIEVVVDSQGRIAQISSPEWPEGALEESLPLLQFSCIEGGQPASFAVESISIDPQSLDLVVRFQHPVEGGIRAFVKLPADAAAVDVSLTAASLRRPDGGMNAGLQTAFQIRGSQSVVTDSPYAVHPIERSGVFKKKYPTGDWMTSKQWFEDVVAPFDAYSLVDLLAEDRGLLILHDGSPQWFHDEQGSVRNLLTMFDPWDEEYWIDRFQASYRLIPHGPLSHSDRWRAAQTFLRPTRVAMKLHSGGDLPASFSAAQCGSPHVAIAALYRETLESGRGLESYAASSFGVDYPYVVRLVELDGVGGPTKLSFAASVASVAETNLMGERTGDGINLDIRPFGIATLMLDLIEGRKQNRDLDAKREIWATVHRL